ncbi:hypothetical protein H5410_061977 [Solanum commersonii]|uniref:Uncharacterized protein n=1 Tax=Solanum commersonii TaxID=4109 RepID=A0A9J5W960_SOLCO|nr:hypothetical protein H5410_061977 [Solanum commersonii]
MSERLFDGDLLEGKGLDQTFWQFEPLFDNTPEIEAQIDLNQEEEEEEDKMPLKKWLSKEKSHVLTRLLKIILHGDHNRNYRGGHNGSKQTQALHNKRKRKTSISKDVQTVDPIDISKEGMAFGSSEIESDDIGKKENEALVEPKTTYKSKSTEGPGLFVRKGKGDTILTDGGIRTRVHDVDIELSEELLGIILDVPTKGPGFSKGVSLLRILFR